ncbi:MAG: helix-turn-helix domain-containing protein [Agriterribacter sp.]
MEQKIHEGRNVKRFREMRGLKQEALADMLGDDWSQKKISQLESKETIDDGILEEVARILKFPAELFRTFDEEKPVNIVSNTFTSHDTSTMNAINPYCTFNPLDKMVETYENMIQLQKEVIGLLQRLVEGK